MNELVRATASVVTLTAIDEAAVHGFALAEKSAATRRAYRSDFGIFSAWCAGRGFEPLPAPPSVVAAFLADQAQAGIRPSTLSRRVAAIAYAHDLAGLPSPVNAKAVRVVLGGIRRTKGAKPAQKAPATAERITAMLEAIPDTLRGKRRSSRVRRPQSTGGVPDQRGRGWCRRAAHVGGIAAQARGDRPGLRPAGQPVQGTRGRAIFVKIIAVEEVESQCGLLHR